MTPLMLTRDSIRIAIPELPGTLPAVSAAKHFSAWICHNSHLQACSANAAGLPGGTVRSREKSRPIESRLAERKIPCSRRVFSDLISGTSFRHFDAQARTAPGAAMLALPRKER